MMSKMFVPIRGTWHGEWVWQEVMNHLAEKGQRAHAPTLAGHGRRAKRTGVTHKDCVDSAVACIRRPSQVNLDQISLTRFDSLNIPTSFIYCRQDKAMPPGYFHPEMSSRLGICKLLEMDGSHEGMFTRPGELTKKLIEQPQIEQWKSWELIKCARQITRQ